MTGETLTAEQTAIAVRVTEFWQLANIGEPDDCWPWGGYAEDGYGIFTVRGRRYPAHELAVTFTTGERRLPGFDTCHSCNNPPCVNPAHLRFDTRKSNVADMLTAGRQNHSWRKLSDEQVSEIKQRVSMGARQKDLAAQYGVSDGMISMIKNGKRYA